jgi:hypothetical protein
MSDLKAPLPPGWIELKDQATGQLRYFNKMVRMIDTPIE